MPGFAGNYTSKTTWCSSCFYGVPLLLLTNGVRSSSACPALSAADASWLDSFVSFSAAKSTSCARMILTSTNFRELATSKCWRQSRANTRTRLIAQRPTAQFAAPMLRSVRPVVMQDRHQAHVGANLGPTHERA